MSPLQPTRPQAAQGAAPLSGRPSTRSLLLWGALVWVLHLGLLLSLAGALDWQLSSPQALRAGPMQVRSMAAPSVAPGATDVGQPPVARTRVALVEKPRPVPKPQALATAAAQPKAPAVPARHSAALSETEPDSPIAADLTTPVQTSPAEPANPIGTDPGRAVPLAAALGAQATGNVLTESPAATAPTDSAASIVALALAPASAPDPAAGLPSSGQANVPSQAPAQVAPTPELMASATLSLPDLPLAALPPSAVLSYSLTGQEKGLNYHASGELHWQRNQHAYAMSLSVKAFLLGSRHWRSVGQILANGLAPTRFSDSWRSERATHFDRPNQRIVFSSNAPSVALQPGAQDQVSLYVQLAAAMAQSADRMPIGTRLQIQTATVRDALPWLLTLEKLETLQVQGQSLQTAKWVCQPRNRFDARVEFWVSATHDWLPARIRITQVSGSFIDLQLTGRQALADLALTP
jgi:hypothetical protein